MGSIYTLIETFQDNLLKLMKSKGATKLSIILNGRYLTVSSKMVYVKIKNNSITNNSELFYFTKRVEKPHESEVHNAGKIIMKDLINQELYGINLGIPFSPDSYNIIIDVDMELLILESGVYRFIRDIAKISDYRSRSFSYNGILVEDKEKLSSLVSTFRERAYTNFSNVIFCKTSNKFIMKLYRDFKFYKTLYSFIPVFIYYPNLYNPLFDNPDNTIHLFEIHRVAMEKNRLVGNPDRLHGYMLTHEEICRACSMTHFMRFTPSFFYELLVGMLNPNLGTFPSTTNKVFVKPENLEIISKLPQCYSRLRFIFEIQKCSTDTDEASKNKLEILKTYVEKDSLYYCCEKNLKNLFNYGPSVIDPPRITADTVYSYLQEMSLTIAKRV